MAIKKEKINGRMLECSIKSTSLNKATYDTLKMTMRVEFVGGNIYEYNNVPISVFTKFRLAKSQGKFLNENISRTYNFRKVKTI